MRISDWSSDVCSSDLDHPATARRQICQELPCRLLKIQRLRQGRPPALRRAHWIENENVGLDSDALGGMLEHRRLADARTTADLDEAMLIEGQVKRLDRFESRKLDTGDAVADLGQSLS